MGTVMEFLARDNGVSEGIESKLRQVNSHKKNRHTLSGMTVFSLYLQLNAIRFV